ncbi:hypothetical protein ACS0TY_006199 [Phlomoides rotata]
MVLLIVHYDVACFLSLRSMESGDLLDFFFLLKYTRSNVPSSLPPSRGTLSSRFFYHSALRGFPPYSIIDKAANARNWDDRCTQNDIFNAANRDDLTGSEWLEKLQQSHIVIRQILFTRMIQRQECQINKKVFGLL